MECWGTGALIASVYAVFPSSSLRPTPRSVSYCLLRPACRLFPFSGENFRDLGSDSIQYFCPVLILWWSVSARHHTTPHNILCNATLLYHLKIKWKCLDMWTALEGKGEGEGRKEVGAGEKEGRWEGVSEICWVEIGLWTQIRNLCLCLLLFVFSHLFGFWQLGVAQITFQILSHLFYCTVLHCTVLYSIRLYSAVYRTLFYTIISAELYYTISYYIISYHIIFYSRARGCEIRATIHDR
jgi:hypothetical protein